MRRPVKSCRALVALLALLPACTSARGLDPRALAATVATPGQAGEAAGVGQLVRPLELGILLEPPAPPADADADAEPLWGFGASDHEKLARVAETLRRDRIASDTVFLDAAAASAADPASIRAAAARDGVDVVLVVRGAADVDRYNNWLGPSYVLLITPLLIPGTVVDALFVAHAELWSVREELLYVSLDAEGTATQTRPAWMVSEERVVALAKERAMSDLAEAVLERFEQLRD